MHFFRYITAAQLVICTTGWALSPATPAVDSLKNDKNMNRQKMPNEAPVRVYPVYLEPAGINRDVAPAGIKRGTTVDPEGHTFDFNSTYFLKDGEPWLPVMGEMHYSRIPRESWSDILDKSKDAGLNIIATYVFWIHHEEEEGVWDWSGNKDLGAFIDLCAEKDLQVVLRIGPWCHGEVRNGGFPDWLLEKGFKLRSPDRGYLKACRKLYEAISKQSKGRYFKDGGPVVGIQLENEYGWKTDDQIKYMYALKEMAVDLGIDVPVYTQFSPTFPPEQVEFMTTKGGYCDAPWGKGSQRQVRAYHYNFKGVTYDSMVGADIFGERTDTVATAAFPTGMAEYGGGFQVTYHRRPRVFPGDISAGAYVKIGSGANLIGYYMFHGGSNPLGKLTTLQESRATQYPNDVPIISYDFQAPLGEWGQAHEQLADLRLLHLALNDFGGQIAQMTAYIPSKEDAGQLRYAVRVLGDEGCLFFNNHTRYLASPPIDGVQFALKRKGAEDVVWPSKPLNIAPDVYGFFPFGWDVAGARLHWATAQPICMLENQGIKTWVFKTVQGVQPEFHFAEEGVRQKTVDGKLTRITTVDGNTVQLLLLSHEEALMAHKVKLGGADYLVLANAMVTADETALRFQLWEGAELQWKSYPALPIEGLSSEVGEDHFTSAKQVFPAATLKVSAGKSQVAKPMSAAVASQPQPGPLYGPEFEMIPGSTTWDLSITGTPAKGATDYLVEVEFDGDTIALYRDNKLIADDFQRGEPMRFLLNRMTEGKFSNAKLKLQIMPFTPAREVYLEEDSLKTDGLTAAIRSIRVTPVYEARYAVGSSTP